MPLQTLQAAGQSADDLAAAVRDHPATNAEVRALCGDLKVLGRSEFKALLRWRLKVRGDVLKARKAAAAAAVRPLTASIVVFISENLARNGYA